MTLRWGILLRYSSMRALGTLIPIIETYFSEERSYCSSLGSASSIWLIGGTLLKRFTFSRSTAFQAVSGRQLWKMTRELPYLSWVLMRIGPVMWLIGRIQAITVSTVQCSGIIALRDWGKRSRCRYWRITPLGLPVLPEV